MTGRNGGLSISYAIDDASESDSDMLAGPSTVPANTVKKRPGRPKGSGKGATSRTASESRGNAGADSSSTGRGKKEIVETQKDHDSDADDFDLPADAASVALSAPVPASKPKVSGKAPAKGGRKPGKAPERKGKRSAEEEPQVDLADTDGEARATSNLSRTPAAKKAPRPAKRDVIPETQPEQMEIDPGADSKPKRAAASDPPARSSKSAGNATQKSKAQASESPQRLDSLTKKFETLEANYQSLRDVGLEEASRNFDKLKLQYEERAEVSAKLLEKYKSEAATASAKSSEISKLQSKMKLLQESNSSLSDETKKLQSLLQAAQNESKALQAKLAANRSTSEQAMGKTLPGSAVKGPASRQVLAANADAQKEIAKRTLKEDLYGDLTGLIIRDVKRNEEDGEDVFDCIQTGRNGTLQFHLSVPNPLPEGATYTGVEIGYEPLLDEDRDRDLIAILPEFAREDICFVRSQAEMFYAGIRDAIQKRKATDAPAAEEDRDAEMME